MQNANIIFFVTKVQFNSLIYIRGMLVHKEIGCDFI